MHLTITDLKLLYYYNIFSTDFANIDALRQEFQRLAQVSIDEQIKAFKDSIL